jgi:hypothetical protein
MAKEFDDIIRKLDKATRSDRALRAALTTTMAIHKPRIFEQGNDSSGNKIGTYDTKPISISKSNQARNTGRTYFKGGYAEYKRAVGKNPGYVNLVNFGQMQADYGIVGSNMEYGFGFQNDLNFDKSQWLQDKYDKDFFDISDQELATLNAVLNFEIQKEL